MKATVEKEACIGCALCEQTCPEVFKMDGDAAVAHVEAVPADDEEKCRQAAQDCPVSCIKVE